MNAMITCAHGEPVRDQWVMPVQPQDLSPYKHRKTGEAGGIEVDLTKAIAEKLGIDLQFKELSIPDGRKAFLNNEVNVDCCLNPIWFPKPEAQIVQLFSDPLYRLMEIWVFPKNMAFTIETTKDLKNKRVGTINGFTYPEEQNFGSRIDGKDVAEVLSFLANGLADVAVLERHAVVYALNAKKLPIEFGRLFYAIEVGLRINKNQAHLLPKINHAIAEMRSSGQIEKIVLENLH